MNNKNHNIEGCILFFLFALLTTISLHGQVGDGSQPLSFSNTTIKTQIPQIIMPSFDVNKLLIEDTKAEKDTPFRFGNPFDVSLNLKNSGIWETLSNGDRIWRLSIKSPNAYSINIIYDQFYLPEGAKLHIYNYAKDYLIGGFTSINNKPSKKFATQPVKGDAIILEYYEPKNMQGQGIISISKVIHAYKDIFNKQDKGYGDSDTCENNINCPEGEPWQNEKRGVAMILLSDGSRICTGCLVNNVNQDATQYFLTANHCLGGEDTWIFMFNYESPTCTNQNGPTNQTVQGSTLLAHYATSDFALLRINETIPSSYNVYYDGWSNQDIAAQSAVGIHHPRGDIKKISFESHSLQSTGYYVVPGDGSHWKVPSWEDGVTEPGSSGSPLFDQNHRIVGQLHGGPSSCTASEKADYYGKIAMSWAGGGTSATRLRDWLDPNNTSVAMLDGFDPNCSANLIISQNISGGIAEYLASNSIVASNTISNGANVHYGANGSITLLPGFSVAVGCAFIADLNGCNQGSLKTTNIGDNLSNSKNNNVTVRNSQATSNVNIFPNPSFDGIISIEVPEETPKSITIYNTLGAIVYKNQNPVKTTSIHLHHSGLLMVIVELTDKTISKKIIVY